jgi:hypothetical protein
MKSRNGRGEIFDRKQEGKRKGEGIREGNGRE